MTACGADRLAGWVGTVLYLVLLVWVGWFPFSEFGV